MPAAASGAAAFVSEFGGFAHVARHTAIVASNLLIPAIGYGIYRARAWRQANLDYYYPQTPPNPYIPIQDPMYSTPRRSPMRRGAGRTYSTPRSGGTMVVRAVRAQQRRKAQKFVKSCLRRWSEMKHVSTTISSSALNTITSNVAYGYQLSLTTIGGGTTAQLRVGNTITLAQLNARLEFSLAAATAAGTARVLVILDHQPAAAAVGFDISDLLQNSSVATSFTSTDVVRVYNLNNVAHGMGRQRFRVLADRVVNVQQNAATVTAPRKVVSMRLRLGNTKVMYSSGTDTTCVTNQLWLVVFSDTNSLSVVGQAQICYFDS